MIIPLDKQYSLQYSMHREHINIGIIKRDNTRFYENLFLSFSIKPDFLSCLIDELDNKNYKSFQVWRSTKKIHIKYSESFISSLRMLGTIDGCTPTSIYTLRNSKIEIPKKLYDPLINVLKRMQKLQIIT